MPVALAGPFTAAELITLALIAALAAIVSVMSYRAWKFSRVTPEERERRRRLALVTEGKMGDATVLEMREDFLFYSYDVRGVGYTASQDLSLLKSYLPADMSVLVGAVSVKYDARNPANSIVLAEDWSGLRAQPRVPEPRK
jgi:hypothetical protein